MKEVHILDGGPGGTSSLDASSAPRKALPSAPTLTLLRTALLLGCGFLCGIVFRVDTAPPPSCYSISTSARGSSSAHSAPAASAQQQAAAGVEQLRTHFAFPPSVTRVILNVGSSKDPPTPPDEHTAVVAVEPIMATARAIPSHPLTFVIVAAISNATGFANFFTYNRNGESSTLADLPDAIKLSTHSSKWWAQDKVRPPDVPKVLFVPVLTLAMLLDAVPPHIRVAFLKTDMQGFDFSAVRAAGHALRRAEVVQSEVLCHMSQLNPAVIPTNFAYNPNAPPNRFDEEWSGWMEELGYELITSPCQGWPTEGDAVWQQASGCSPEPCLLPSPSPSPAAEAKAP